MTKFACIYDSDKEREARSDAAGFKCVGDSLTVQSDAKEADINFIMDRYLKTRQMPGLARLPEFGDFTGISDFREALHAVRDAEALFMQLPAKIRAKMENDPAQFVEFCSTVENREELADLGLLAPEVSSVIKKAREARAAAAAEEPSGVTRAPREAARAAGNNRRSQPEGGAGDAGDGERQR